MLTKDIQIGDLLLAKLDISTEQWIDKDGDNVIDLNLYVLDIVNNNKCYCITSYNFGQIVDDTYPQYTGRYSCFIEVSKIINLIHRQKKIGEFVNISIKDLLKNSNSISNDISKLEIISHNFSDEEIIYLVKIPDNLKTFPKFIINEYDLKEWNLSSDFIGTKVFPFSYKRIFESDLQQKSSGLSCMNKFCKTFCSFVTEFNCPHDVFLCYSCRTNPLTYSIVMSQYE